MESWGPAGLDAHDRRNGRANRQPRVHLRRRLSAPVRIAGNAGEREPYDRRVDCGMSSASLRPRVRLFITCLWVGSGPMKLLLGR